MIQLAVASLSQALGLDGGAVRILLCLVLTFPLSAVFKRLPDHRVTLKNLYIIAVLLFYVFGILQVYLGFRTLLVALMGSYMLTRYVRLAAMPWLNFAFVMGHLAFNHFDAQFFAEYDPTVVDITGAQMVLVMKLSAFGWNVYDGRCRALDPAHKLSLYAEERVVLQHPLLLLFLGYTFFFPLLVTGPAFDYADYDKFIHGTLFDDVPDAKRPGRRRKRTIPRSGRPAAWKAAQGVFWSVVLFVLEQHILLDYAVKGVELRRFVFRVVYLYALGFMHRLKYYTAWLFAEAGCIVCGIGYNGVDAAGNILWNRVQNIDIWALETAQNSHAYLESWNMNTNKWLKNYVYLRVARPGRRPGFKLTLFTFITSAFWHGTRPGYYMAFATGALLQTCGRLFRRNLRPVFLLADGLGSAYKPAYDVVCWVVTQLAFGYTVQPFVALDLSRSWAIWKNVYLYVHVGVLVTMVVFRGPSGKAVTAWLRRYHGWVPPKKETKEPSRADTAVPKTEAATPKPSLPPSPTFEFDDADIGYPDLEHLEQLNPEEFQEAYAELKQRVEEFRAAGSHDPSGLADAYANFKQEISSLVEGTRPKTD